LVTEISLDLDLDTEHRGTAIEPIARVAVIASRGLTRDGGAPTITADCRSLVVLEREVERLRAELASVLERAAAHFGQAPASAAPALEAPAAPAGKPHLAAEFRVADVMTRDVQTVGPNDPASLADDLMRRGRFRHVVVRGSDERVAGVLSRRDIVYSPLAWTLGAGKTAYEKALAAHPVKSMMTSPAVTVDSQQLLSEAASLMLERRIGCLPVVDGDRLVGILTESDFVTLVAGHVSAS
jgi:CBS domain-containing protein